MLSFTEDLSSSLRHLGYPLHVKSACIFSRVPLAQVSKISQLNHIESYEHLHTSLFSMHIRMICFLNSKGFQSKQTFMPCLRSKVWLWWRHCHLIYFVYARMCVVQALLALGFISSLRQRGTSQLFGGCVCNMHSVFCVRCFLCFCFYFQSFLLFPEQFLFRCFLCFNVSCFSWKNYVSMFLVFLWKIKFFNSRIVQYQESCSPQSFAEAHQLLLSNLARTSCLSFFYKIIYDALHYLFKHIGKIL